MAGLLPCRGCGRRVSGLVNTLCRDCNAKPAMQAECRRLNRLEAPADFNGEAPLPDAPTPALPGTPQKVLALADRARASRALWHPDDAVVPDGAGLLVRRQLSDDRNPLEFLGVVQLQGQPAPARFALAGCLEDD